MIKDRETCVRQGIGREQLTVHADRGPAMTSKPVALLLADLGVTQTHARPHVSNDNPFSDAQFQDAEVPAGVPRALRLLFAAAHLFAHPRQHSLPGRGALARERCGPAPATTGPGLAGRTPGERPGGASGHTDVSFGVVRPTGGPQLLFGKGIGERQVRRKYILVIAALALAAVLAGVLRPRKDVGEVRIGSLPIIASLPIFIADENQLFAQENVRSTTIPFSSSNDMVNALVVGQVDVLPAVSLVPIVHLEIQSPGKVRVFSHSRMSQSNALDKIIVKDGSGLRRVEDLRGKKLGVFPGTAPTNMLRVFLRKHGVDPKTIAFVQLPAPVQLSSLESGAVDALFAYEPVTTTALAHGGYRPLFGSVYADLLNPCPIGVSVISREFEKRHPELARRTVSALQQSVTYMVSHPKESRGLLPKFTKIPPDIAVRVNVADVTLSNQVDVVNLQQFLDLLYDSGEIPARIDAHRLVTPTQ